MISDILFGLVIHILQWGHFSVGFNYLTLLFIISVPLLYVGVGTASWCQRVESWGQSCGCSFSCCFNCPLSFPLPRCYNNRRGYHHPQSIRKRSNTFKSPSLSCLCVIRSFQQWVGMRSFLCLTICLIFTLSSLSFKETIYVLHSRRWAAIFKWKWALSLNFKMVNCKGFE